MGSIPMLGTTTNDWNIMTGFVIAFLFVGFFVLTGWLCYMGVEADEHNLYYWIGAGVMAVIGLTVVINGAIAAEESGPCLEKSTSYVKSGDVMVPYEFCTKRGEWVDQ